MKNQKKFTILKIMNIYHLVMKSATYGAMFMKLNQIKYTRIDVSPEELWCEQYLEKTCLLESGSYRCHNHVHTTKNL